MRRNKGFTLIELLIVVAIIGIIAAIAIPNLLNAINRGRQKRSMSDLRTLGTATEAYAVDHSFYPTLADSNVDAFAVHLETTYVKRAPKVDGWREAFGVDSYSRAYTFRSLGLNKTAEAAFDAYTEAQTTDFDCDIVYTAGTFLWYPEGVQNE
jgi:general secretion pathway protein G